MDETTDSALSTRIVFLLFLLLVVLRRCGCQPVSSRIGGVRQANQAARQLPRYNRQIDDVHHPVAIEIRTCLVSNLAHSCTESSLDDGNIGTIDLSVAVNVAWDC